MVKVVPADKVDEKILKTIKSKIFIYPTDTIYGIGCNAENKELVEKIRKIKGRDKKPFSIIAPTFEYILKHCQTTITFLKKYLPGPYTLILKKKNYEFLSYVSETKYIGIRIPDHPLTKLLQKTGKPIITTSVNKSGEKYIEEISEIKDEIKNQTDLIIDAGPIKGKPSTIIKDGEEIKR